MLDFTLVLGRGHVDEIDHDQATHVAQAQLAGDFFGRFQVGLQGSLLDIVALGGPGGVDVDGYQRFGRIDHDGAARRQFYFALECGLNLAFNLVTAEQWDFILVQLDLVFEGGHDGANEAQDVFVHAFGVDQDFADVLAEVVAHGADDHVAFLVNQERSLALTGRLGNGFPELHQVVEVPLELFGGTADAGSTHNDAHRLGHLDAVHGFFQLGPLFTFDAAGNAAGTGVVRHQHQVATGQGDEGGQGCALVATLFFIDLYDDFLAFGDHIFDVDLAFDLARGLLEVFLGDFLQGKEAVAVGAEVDKGSFQAGLYAGDAAFVNVGFFLFAGAGFDIQVKQPLAVYKRYAQLFGVSCIDQHSFHGKKGFLSFVSDRKPEGSHQRSRMCVPQALLQQGGAGGQTDHTLMG